MSNTTNIMSSKASKSNKITKKYTTLFPMDFQFEIIAIGIINVVNNTK